MTLIRVPRSLVELCAEELNHLPGWKTHPCSSLKELIYGLNTIEENFKFYRFRDGFPRPSEAVRELKGIRGLASTAARTGNASPLCKRLKGLQERDTGGYRLILFRMASVVSPSHPEAAVIEPETENRLLQLADSAPDLLVRMANEALEQLAPLVELGRGGDRNKGPTLERQLLFELGCLFESVVRRPPGVTTNAYADKNPHGGPFLEFAGVVFGYLGLENECEHLFRIYRALDIPEWDSPQKDKPSWRSPL